jgi:peptidoglycan/LPS O-acetylase OafA/YrhL
MSKADSPISLAIENLRGYAVLMVVAFHSFIAYMASLPPTQPSFDGSPGDWMAHPIIDSHRWLGFDLFGAFQFLQLMQLMFFLSGLFVWSSLVRKGAATFVRDRIVRLGVPFVLGVSLLMPFAYYPVYRVGAVDPSWSGFWSHWMALPFWPSGPLWFLWCVLALNVVAAGLFWLAPASGKYLGRLSVYIGIHPRRFFVGLVIASGLAYLPMAATLPPWQWVEFGPFGFQPSFSLQYAVYFFAGLAVGIHGFERGFLAANETLAQHWGLWVAGAFAAFLLWVIPAALIVNGLDAQLPLLPVARELGLVLFSATACFGSVALFLRFATTRRPLLGSISDNAYGIYLFHYVFVVWVQYALLEVPLPGIAKGAIALALALALSWAVSAGVSTIPIGARLIGGVQRPPKVESHSPANGRSQFGLSD